MKFLFNNSFLSEKSCHYKLYQGKTMFVWRYYIYLFYTWFIAFSTTKCWDRSKRDRSARKKVLIVSQFNLPLGNLIWVIFCYSNFSRYSLFVKNDQYKILDLIVYNLLGFWNFDFWPYGRLEFWFLGICRSYMYTSSCNR